MIKFKHPTDLQYYSKTYTKEVVKEFLRIAKLKAISDKYIYIENGKYITVNRYKINNVPKWYQYYWYYRGAYTTGSVKRVNVLIILTLLLELDNSNNIGNNVLDLLNVEDNRISDFVKKQH